MKEKNVRKMRKWSFVEVGDVLENIQYNSIWLVLKIENLDDLFLGTKIDMVNIRTMKKIQIEVLQEGKLWPWMVRHKVNDEPHSTYW